MVHRLEELPAISAAYAAGELSWDQTRHLARFATPETDEELAWRGARMSVNALSLEARRHEPVPRTETRGEVLGPTPRRDRAPLEGLAPERRR